MSPVAFAMIWGLVGLSLGLVSHFALRKSDRQRADWAVVDEPTISDGAAQVLAVVGQAYVLVDAVDGVVRASQGSYAYGLVRGHSMTQPELLDLIRQVRRDGVILEKTVEISRGPLGKGVLVLNVRIAPVADEYILLLADDRTEITRAQAIRTDFVANVSHELKTPVGAVRLLAEAIEGSSEDPEAVRHFTKRLHKETTRLTALVHDIIELSRLQGTDIVQKGKVIDLNQLVHEAADRNKLTAENKNISIRVGGTATRPVLGDPELLMTALRNLIDNAIRYSPDNTRIGVGIRSKEGMISVSVKDQGPGIPEEEQDRIFERFYRVDAARSRQTGGTGLGLSIVKHVMAQHGGEITLWSTPGQGSTFTVTLPELDEATEKDLRSSESEPAPIRDQEPVSIVRMDQAPASDAGNDNTQTRRDRG
ncbi:sensor histidine kinase [Curtobacterium sp. S6]|uniref:sensor histidine kinase n=1 Tax=Curtobacterium sp. S6 TaxID=1479623 RepID=UPI001F203334|nr:ATP-binding protein [Curtobacterium sp. S6]